MGNEQVRPLSAEFVAGLLVGESWFGLTVQNTKHHSWTIRPRFCIQMDDLETMAQVIDFFKENDLPAYIVNPKRGGIRLEVGGIKRVKKLLEFFLPLLTGHKRDVAKVIQEYIDLRLSRPKHSGSWTEMELALANKVKSLNAGNGKRKVTSETIRRTEPTLLG